MDQIMQSKKFYCIGAVNIDRVYLVSHVVLEGDAINCKNYAEYWGGKGLNQVIALGCAGESPLLCAKVGERDYSGLCELLKRKGLESSYICPIHGYTNHGVIQVLPDGKTAILGAPNLNVSFSQEEIDIFLKNVVAGDVIVLQNEIDQIPYVIQKAKDSGCIVVLNPSPLSEDVCNLPWACVDLLVLNENEARCITKKTTVDEMLSMLMDMCPNGEILLTLGEKGCFFQNASERYYQPCFQTQTVDTIGAGDTFEGFFLAQYLVAKDVREALSVAARAASIVVGRVGAAEMIPSLREVKEKIADVKL